MRVADGAKRALVFFAACAGAKLCIAGTAAIVTSPWAPVAWWGPDARAALCAFPVLALLGAAAAWPARVALVAAVGWTALAVPIARTLGSPPTRAMLGAAGAPLEDSVAQHLSLENFAWIGAVALLALFAAWLARRSSERLALGALALLGACAALEPISAQHVATRGLERNALWTLAFPAALPELPSDEPHAAALARARAFAARPLDPGCARWSGACRGASLVIVVLESAASRAVGAWGAAPDAMPRVSRFAREGLRVEAAYAAYPESIRGQIALFFGIHPAPGLEARDYAGLRSPSIARVLADAGYATALFHSGYFDYLDMRPIVEACAFARAEDASSIGGESAASFGVPEERTIERALAWVSELDPALPFALAYLPIAGHHPYAAPKGGPFRGSSEIDAWRNALHYADRCVGELWDGLVRCGRAENTVLAIVGDHGQAFGEHPSNYGHSFFLYEENLRVPLLIAAPGRGLPACEIPGVASQVDLVPTLLDLLGLSERAADMEGRSLLRGEEGAALFFADYGLPWIGLREGRWKWIQDLASSRCELYDLEKDPAERNDLAALEPERAQAYAARSQAWWGAQQRRFREGR